jgi:hypothetical protein
LFFPGARRAGAPGNPHIITLFAVIIDALEELRTTPTRVFARPENGTRPSGNQLDPRFRI